MKPGCQVKQSKQYCAQFDASTVRKLVMEMDLLIHCGMEENVPQN